MPNMDLESWKGCLLRENHDNRIVKCRMGGLYVVSVQCKQSPIPVVATVSSRAAVLRVAHGSHVQVSSTPGVIRCAARK